MDEINRLKAIAAYNEVRADNNTIRADKLEQQLKALEADFAARQVILDAAFDLVNYNPDFANDSLFERLSDLVQEYRHS